jgi:predicted phage tail protein
MSELIRGGGGGGKGGGKAYNPKTAPDGLDSRQYAQLIDLISEGEIQGLKDGLKSIFINNTPLQASNSSFNFQDVLVYTRNGTQSQDAIPFASSVESEIGVGTQVLKSLPVTRTIVNPSVDAARITITVPQLQRFTDKGDLLGTSIRLQIAVQYAGGGFTTVVDDTITGRTGDTYQRDYLVNFNGARPLDIRVTRITDDSTNPKLTNAFSWTSYTEITWAKLRYPNSALVGLRVNAEQFSSIPQRSYLVRGIKVQIPSNATVDSATGRLTYSGVWNGTFGAAQWCSDPAWILWDLLTSTRYGFGDHIQAAQLDKWSFYSASQYASALVPNGFGGQEPRFSCNVNIQTPQEAYKLINDLCSVFRAMPYWSAGALTVSQDKPVDPSYLFTLANVAEGGFSYQSSAQKTRPTVAVVGYLNLETREIEYEAVEDQVAIAKYGVVTTQIEAFACTSRGQAARLGEWLLYAEQYESEVISFTTSIDAGVIVRPGQIIEVADPLRAGSRRGGRIASATTGTVTVDDATGLPSSGGTVSVILPNGTVEQRNMSSRSGKVLTVSSAFSLAPGSNSVWIYQSDGLQASTWRVLAVQEQDGSNYVVNALAYNESKYDYIERDRPLQQRDVTNFNELPEPPTNLAISEELYVYQDQIRAKVVVSWKSVSGVNQYQVRWRKDQGNWLITNVSGPDYEILDTTPGFFEFEISSVNVALKLSATPLTGDIAALGKTAPPSNVSNFTFSIDDTLGVLLSWDPVADIDLDQYEIRRGANWDNATLVTQVKASTYKLGVLEAGTYTYLIKAIDTSRSYSSATSSVSVEITAPGAPVATASIQGTDAIITWSAPTVASYAIDYYVVRRGPTYAGSIEVTRTGSTTFTVPINWTGTQIYWIVAVDVAGRVTSSPNSTVISISVPPAPTVTQSVSGEELTLKWGSVQGSLPTAEYEVRRGALFSSALVLTKLKSLSFTTRADFVGANVFWIVAIDENGNYGTGGSTSTTIIVPPAPTINKSVVGADVTLSWNAVEGSLPTAEYEVRTGGTFSTATVLTRVSALSYGFRADFTGSRTYWVVAIDANKNFGTAASTSVSVNTAPSPSVGVSFSGQNAVLAWDAVEGSLDIEFYRLKRGSTYATAALVADIKGTAYTLKVDWSGSQLFWLAAVDINGAEGAAGSIDIVVTAPAAPSITQQVIDNNVLLRWNDVTRTLPILNYELRRGATWEGATVVGTKQGGFTSVFETAAGTYIYWLAGIDSAGNYGTPGSVAAIVNQPPDYVLQLDQQSSWAGAEVNIYTDAQLGQIVNVNTTETWQSHFTSRGWASPQAQITAGYSYYLMPTTTTASYEEEVDAGTLLAGTKVSASLTTQSVSGSTTITPTLRVRGTTSVSGTYSQSGTTITVTRTAHGYVVGDYVYIDFTSGTAVDGTYVVATATANTFTVTASAATTSGNCNLVKWTTYAGVSEVYATQFRYIRVRYDFSSAGGDDILVLSSLNIRLDAKIRNDSGNGTANAGDVGGTTVTFNYAFVDVQSISVTPLSTSAVIAVYDFVDIPNPTSFKVLLFDTAGNRVSGAFSWAARGV